MLKFVLIAKHNKFENPLWDGNSEKNQLNVDIW